jgi:hypothetical protein
MMQVSPCLFSSASLRISALPYPITLRYRIPHEHGLSPLITWSQISTSKQQRGFFSSIAIFFPSGAEWM